MPNYIQQEEQEAEEKVQEDKEEGDASSLYDDDEVNLNVSQSSDIKTTEKINTQKMLPKKLVSGLYSQVCVCVCVFSSYFYV